MLLEVSHHQINTNLTNQLQNTDSSQINDCGWVINQKLDGRDKLTLDNGVCKNKEESPFVGCSEKMVGSGMESNFGVSL